ncbi:hypothetical protein EON65_49570 [archaeon]|nr:MAG: hypothetical protein EON65_49570 [archaeon]
MQVRQLTQKPLDIYDKALLGIKPKPLLTKISRQELTSSHMDALEETILSKVEVLSGFADGNGKVRYLFQTLKFYDKNNVGYISFPDFLDVLQKFNLMNLSREAEDLFNRYDADMLGHVDCRDLAHRVYRLSPHNRTALSAAGKSTVFAQRSALAARGWQAGVRYVRQTLQLQSLDTLGFASLQDMVENIGVKTERVVNRRAFVALLLELTGRRDDDKVDLFAYLDALKVSVEANTYTLMYTHAPYVYILQSSYTYTYAYTYASTQCVHEHTHSFIPIL